MDNDELLDLAMSGFWSALGVVDPLRIEAWDNLGLTVGQLRLMSQLLDGGKSMSELADRLDVKLPTVTGLADRLVRMGMVERHDDPDDRRIVRIDLTEGGRHAMRQVEAVSREFLGPVFQRMGPERVRRFIEVFDEFMEAARQVREEARRSAAVAPASHGGGR